MPLEPARVDIKSLDRRRSADVLNSLFIFPRLYPELVRALLRTKEINELTQKRGAPSAKTKSCDARKQSRRFLVEI